MELHKKFDKDWKGEKKEKKEVVEKYTYTLAQNNE